MKIIILATIKLS